MTNTQLLIYLCEYQNNLLHEITLSFLELLIIKPIYFTFPLILFPIFDVLMVNAGRDFICFCCFFYIGMDAFYAYSFVNVLKEKL